MIITVDSYEEAAEVAKGILTPGASIEIREDPDTGKRLARIRASSDWIITDVPHLRIVDDAL
jgi:hypothetical protein